MAYTTINDPSAYFQITLYTGNGGTQSITNGGNSDLQPDWLWIKDRDDTYKHLLVDSVRGATKHLSSINEAAEVDNTANVTSFASDGFALSSDGNVNANADNYVAWQWKESATAGFDIVGYTGNGSARTISHSLSAVPSMMIVKSRSVADKPWAIYHHKNTSAPATDFLSLNNTNATADSSAYWNDTAPTSSVFTVGTTNDVNQNGTTYIAYLFSEVKGFSKFGSYTGNGNADGPFSYTGFKPAWIMIKRTDSANSWTIRDSKRSTFNVMQKSLFADLNNAESDSADYNFDFLSNGFKQRNANGIDNASGGTYIYMAFAESPFVTSTGIPTTTR